MATDRLPPNDLRAAIAAALSDPAVRAELADLLTGATDARERRRAELAAELDAYELTWERKEPEE
jgi:hypothetical protein